MFSKNKIISGIILGIMALFMLDYFAGLGIFRKSVSKDSATQVEKTTPHSKKEKKQREDNLNPSEISSEAVQGEFYNVYFSQVYSGDPKSAEENPNSIDRPLNRALDNAKKQIYAAIHQLNCESITSALINAHKRGVEIKIVTEDKYIDEKSIQQLKQLGIPVVDDSSEGGTRLMHNKFFVIDGEWVWTGSVNPTYNCCYKNNNNGILIHSSKLATNFIDEFNEMFVYQRFGKKRLNKKVKNEIIQFEDGTVIRTLFAPENDVASQLINELKKAKISIQFLAFSFTHDEMGDVMIEKFNEGVKVQGVFEGSQAKTKDTEYHRFKKLGVDVRLDGNKYNMHHKVIVIDNRVTIMGSFNFSSNADKRNDENVLIIENPIIAKAFQDEFKRLFEVGLQ